MSINENKTWGAPQGHDRCRQKQNRAGYAAKTPICQVKWDYKEQKHAYLYEPHKREMRSITWNKDVKQIHGMQWDMALKFPDISWVDWRVL